MSSTEAKPNVDTTSRHDEEDHLVLMLYDDDYNTFDHVISTLIKVCKHHAEQAEQVAIIVHTKGKCDVQHGPKSKLQKQLRQLLDAGLTAKIEE
ncbi:MAG: hypothetical protein Kow0075_05840 [Salibacteraceae bacterium]